MEPSEDEASLLVVLLDTNPLLWGERAFSRSNISSAENNLILFETLLEHLFVFLNAYLMIKHQNMISIIANHIGDSKFLFPKDNQTENQHIDFSEIKNLVVAELKQLAKGEIPTNLAPTFSGALSLALCYINRISKEKLQIKPRILVLQISPDVSSHYIPVMNCIFSAQKKVNSSGRVYSFESRLFTTPTSLPYYRWDLPQTNTTSWTAAVSIIVLPCRCIHEKILESTNSNTSGLSSLLFLSQESD